VGGTGGQIGGRGGGIGHGRIQALRLSRKARGSPSESSARPGAARR
jgi:hypothetical protein